MVMIKPSDSILSILRHTLRMKVENLTTSGSLLIREPPWQKPVRLRASREPQEVLNRIAEGMRIRMTDTTVPAKVTEQGYALFRGENVEFRDRPLQQEFREFRESWGDLPFDHYAPLANRYRRFMECLFHPVQDSLKRLPHGPFLQYGSAAQTSGLSRLFEPIHQKTAENPFLQDWIRMLFLQFGIRGRAVYNLWKATVHQYRVKATTEKGGKPVPEKRHQDGFPYVSVALMRLRNASGGMSEIALDQDGPSVLRDRLEEPMDTIVLDDSRVFHDASDIHPIGQEMEAIRDVLVINFDNRNQPKLKELERAATPMISK